MKIVYIFRSIAEWGGIERILAEKMNRLSAMKGYDICLLTYNQGAHRSPYRISDRVNVADLDIRFHQQYRYRGVARLVKWWQLHRLFTRRLKEYLNRECPDIIVCTTAEPVMEIACVKGSTPLVVESHSVKEFTFGQHNRLEDYLLRRGLHRASVIVSLTENDASCWRKEYKNVSVIPNMVCLNDSGQYSTQEEKRVVFVGRLDYQKQVMSMINIWQRVYPAHPDWQLDIYGDGPDRQAAEQAAAQLGMNITVHKPTAGIFDVYRQSAVLALPSLFEPFGLVIVEAMSCGVPVVAYSSYGPDAMVNDGTDGYVVPNRY